MAPIVIVGSGLAGYTVARELRKLDRQVPVVMVTADDGGFYSKPMLSNALAAGKTPGPARADAGRRDWRPVERRRSAAAHPGRAASLPRAQVVHTDAGRSPTRKLVLALGADPIRLPLAGDGAGASCR